MQRPPKPTKAEKKKQDDEQPMSTRDLRIEHRRIEPSSEWRERLSEAKKMTALELCDVVYALAREGAPLSVIAAYYGLDHHQLKKVAGDAWNMANAELVIEIFRDQIMTALHSKQVLAKIYVGKQFAGQRDAEPLSADISQTADAGGLTINLNVTKANRDEHGRTQEAAAVESAVATEAEPTTGSEVAAAQRIDVAGNVASLGADDSGVVANA